jgi:hypothetical protein
MAFMVFQEKRLETLAAQPEVLHRMRICGPVALQGALGKPEQLSAAVIEGR